MLAPGLATVKGIAGVNLAVPETEVAPDPHQVVGIKGIGNDLLLVLNLAGLVEIDTDVERIIERLLYWKTLGETFNQVPLQYQRKRTLPFCRERRNEERKNE